MDEKETCDICVEAYNKVNHKKITCLYCDFSSCNKCIQKYMLSQIQDPHCMHCKKIWTREFIDERMSKQFINTELKSQRETILFEKEKNLLPETQDNVKLLQQQEEYEHEMKLILEDIERLQKRYDEIERKKNEINPYRILPKQKMPQLRTPCLIKECRGYIEEQDIKTDLSCGICGTNVCYYCREILNATHVCNQENIKTIRMIDKETKRCPSCFVPIFKINGCDQMWCTSCHIAFDWKTGERVRGIIHNPHYHEYIEKNGGTPVLLEASYQRFDFLETDLIVRVLESQQCPELVIYQIIEIYRYIIHYHEVDLQRLPSRFDETVNLDLRIQFLQAQISEDEFKIKLQRRQKDIDKKIEYKDIGETFVEIMNDVFISFMETHNRDALIQNIKSVTKTTQDAITNLNRRYNSNLPLVRNFL
jgi:hypothetical protein